jgi:hypothetical protein
MLIRAGQFYRTCQECGHVQLAKDPQHMVSDAYCNAKCKRCKSEALDYGTTRAKDFEAD